MPFYIAPAFVLFQDDPFSSSDPFGSSFSSSSGGNKQMDAFDPFGTSSNKPQVSDFSALFFHSLSTVLPVFNMLLEVHLIEFLLDITM